MTERIETGARPLSRKFDALKQQIEKAGWQHSHGSLDVVYVNDVIDWLDEVRADALAPPEPGWQPIETAPKDGRWFWTWRDTGGSRSQMNVSAFKWDGDERGWFAGTGWWPQFPKTFTHWREMKDQPEPLPAPPRADALEAPRTEKLQNLAIELRSIDEAFMQRSVYSHDRICRVADQLEAAALDAAPPRPKER